MLIGIDLDGTLITCKNRQTIVLNAVLKQHRVTSIDASLVWEMKREGNTTYDALIAQRVSPEICNKICSEWTRLIEEPQWLEFDRLFSDVLQALQKLKSNNRNALILISARKFPHWAKPQIRKLGLDIFFDEVQFVSHCSISAKKAEILKEKQCFAFFGDSESDLEAARISGVDFFAVSTGQRSRDYLISVGSKNVYNSFSGAVESFLS